MRVSEVSGSLDSSPSVRSRWRRGPARPLVLGHRGASRNAPENTMLAFELARQAGADGVELDVRLNASGELIVCHDDSLERVTRGRHEGRVSNTTASHCSSVLLPEGQQLPKLWQVLDWAARHESLVNIEMKADGPLAPRLPAALSEQLSRLDAVQPLCLVSCFDWALLRDFASRHQGVATGWLLESEQTERIEAVPAGSAAHPHHEKMSEKAVQRCVSRDVAINTWTVNDADRASELASFGVNCLIGDDPGLLLKALSSAARSANG